MEAIVANTRNNAYAVGLEGELGEISPGKLADVLILDADPLADITVLQGGKHLTAVIKDGRRVDLTAGRRTVFTASIAQLPLVQPQKNRHHSRNAADENNQRHQ